MEPKQSTYSADSPIQRREDDVFSRWNFSSNLAETIVRRTDNSCLVMGLYGEWGSGKTSVLNLMESALETHEGIISFRFNPWIFTSHVELLQRFFHSLADELDLNLSSKKEKIGEAIREYGDVISPVSISIGGGFASVNVGKSILAMARKSAKPNLEQLKARVKSMLQNCGKRVVVFIDDIDRLDYSEIQTIFKLVKLAGDFENLVYILSFDDEVVAKALQQQYPSADKNYGNSFLDKIVQVPVNLPKLDTVDLRHVCINGINRILDNSGIHISEEESQRFLRGFIDGLEIRLRTPRICKRYLNALALAVPLQKDEVNYADLLLIEGIRIFFPQLYSIIRENPELILSTREQPGYESNKEEPLLELLNPLFSLLSPKDKSSIIILLKTLFPQTSRALENYPTSVSFDEEWVKSQRICSEDYFHRYFSYSTQNDDISDVQISTLLGDLSSKSLDIIREDILEIITVRNAEKFIFKLRRREEGLAESDSVKLCLAVSSIAAQLPNQEQFMSFSSSWNQAAILCYKLLLNIGDLSIRFDTAKSVIEKSNPLPFALECFRWFKISENDASEKFVFGEKHQRALSDLLLKRIVETAKDEPLFIRYPKEGKYLLRFIADHGDQEWLREYLVDCFNKTPENVAIYISSFLSAGYSMESGAKVGYDLHRESYDALLAIIDKEILYKYLVALYPDEIPKATSPAWQYHDENLAKMAALKFASFYNREK